MSNRIKIILFIAVISAALAVLEYLRVPSNTFFWRSVFDFGHIPLFGVISIAFLELSYGLFKTRFHDRYLNYLLAFVLTSGLGFITEVLQYFGPRDADFWDIVRDVIGAICFLGYYMTIDRKMNDGKYARSGNTKRLIRWAVVLIFVACMIPTCIWSWAYLNRANRFPIISNFESRWENKFRYTKFASLEIIKAPPSMNFLDRSQVGKLTLKSNSESAFYIEEPYPDWTSYNYFLFDIYSEYTYPISLIIRINDRIHDQNSSDRFNRKLSIKSGLNNISIPLDAVQNAPKTRLMDMRNIDLIIIFTSEPAESLVVYLDNIRLE